MRRCNYKDLSILAQRNFRMRAELFQNIHFWQTSWRPLPTWRKWNDVKGNWSELWSPGGVFSPVVCCDDGESELLWSLSVNWLGIWLIQKQTKQVIAILQVWEAPFHCPIAIFFFGNTLRTLWWNAIAFLLVPSCPMLWIFLRKTWSCCIVKMPCSVSEKE